MALPTRGRVLLDTTAGDIDIELWSKVCATLVRRRVANVMRRLSLTGSTESMQEFHCVGHGGCAYPSLSLLNIALTFLCHARLL